MAKAKNQGHSQFTQLVKKDWIRAIEQDPETFDAILYPADLSEPDAPEEGAPLFGSLDDDRDVQSYLAPEPVLVVESPDDGEGFWLDDAGEASATQETPILVRIAREGVPQRSVLQWFEENGDGVQEERYYYVLSVQGVGSANIGALYRLIPFGNPETLPERSQAAQQEAP